MMNLHHSAPRTRISRRSYHLLAMAGLAASLGAAAACGNTTPSGQGGGCPTPPACQPGPDQNATSNMAGFVPSQDPMVTFRACSKDSTCGTVIWQVDYTLPNPSQNGGWVVQKITVNFSETVLGGHLACNPSHTEQYWEAFYIGPGQMVTTIYGTSGADTYKTFHDFYSTGTDITMGLAKFYEGTLPPDFVSCNTATSAGSRRSTTQQPPGWDDNSGTPHNLNVMWDCTAAANGDNGTFSVQSTPSDQCSSGGP